MKRNHEHYLNDKSLYYELQSIQYNHPNYDFLMRIKEEIEYLCFSIEECSNEKIKNLESDLTYCENEKSDLEDEIYDLRDERYKLEKKVEELEQEVEDLKENISNLKERIAE